MTLHNPADHWLTVDQAATALSLTSHHVYRSIRAGVLPSASLGSTLVIPREWVDAAAATKTSAASRTRIDWAAASAAYEMANPTTNHSTNDDRSSDDNNMHVPGAEHALDPQSATAG